MNISDNFFCFNNIKYIVKNNHRKNNEKRFAVFIRRNGNRGGGFDRLNHRNRDFNISL